ncbi:MAG TPA: peptidylprolyl isomerase [Longimicrobiales bacterium]|nr:peptidylprolyl isomerase [Longimicrobiales bacterium]
MTRTLVYIALAGLLTSGCSAFGDAMSAHSNVVARAGAHELTVKQMLSFMHQNDRITPDPGVVQAIADLWVDYTLLATAGVEDSTLSSVDMEPVVESNVEQGLFQRIRNEVVGPDTTISDEELQAIYEQQQPGTRVHARHILFSVPSDATPEQRDSIHAEAEKIRQRALAGEDFAKLAREYSQDPGTAQKGGDLGTFGRGQMVGPFEDAAFALKPGQISDVVETPFGYHIIKVESRETPSLQKMGPQFRQQVLQQREQKRLQAFVDSLTSAADVQVVDGAVAAAQDVAKRPDEDLSSRARRHPLVHYKSGAVTVGDVQDLVRRSSPGDRARLASMPATQMEGVLQRMAQNKIVLREARARNLGPSDAALDSMRADLRVRLHTAAQRIGLLPVHPQEGETMDAAIDRRVRSLLNDILAGRSSVLNLGELGYSLRDAYNAKVYPRSFAAVADAAKQQTSGGPGAASAAPAPADTSGE